MEKINISVVIPCYNEEKILPESIFRLEKFFFEHQDKFVHELIFVDDGSKDKTLNILNSYFKGNDHVRILTSRYNVGKGFAIKRGLMIAKHNNILLLDADLSVRPDELLYNIKKIDFNGVETFIVCGERKYAIPQTKFRIFLGKGFSVLHKIWLNVGVWDSQCPFKILHNIDYTLIQSLQIDGFAYDLELLYKAKKSKIPIHPITVSYFNVLDSRVTIWKTLRMFHDMVKIRFL